MIHNNQEKGLLGEKLAAQYLQAHGYEILASRYRTRNGEADLVARIQDTLVFVEVKARTNTKHGTPAEAVTAKKQKNATMAAMAYLQQNGCMDALCRFDVVEVFLPGGQICHITNAFDACM